MRQSILSRFLSALLQEIPKKLTQMRQSMGLLQFAFLLILSISSSVSGELEKEQDFIQCLLDSSNNSTSISEIIFTSNSSNYTSILNFYLQNLRYTAPNTPKPIVILTPVHESQIQLAINCSRIHGLQIRTRSGGHDFEALSSVAHVPFFILDLFNLRSINVDAENRTAWVESGATLGELYYAINQTNSSLAYPAGYWPTVGIGGHISGGGYGPLVRKYGIAVDHVVDARIVDVHGRILDRQSMGEDLFWAIRGAIGASFGVILSYKVNLTEVPEKVAAVTIRRTLEENATGLVYKWQFVAPKLPQELMISLELIGINSTETHNNRTILATFHSVFLGNSDGLLEIITKKFPELGVTQENCTEMSWVEYYAYYLRLPLNSTFEILLSRIPPKPKVYFKSKSDLVRDPIPVSGLQELWNQFFKIEARAARMRWTPYGGRMDEIPESETPFPFRAGNLFIIYQNVQWNEFDEDLAEKRMNWMRDLHSIFGNYVPTNPRYAYANYRDLDLGVNQFRNTSVRHAKVWAVPYFKNNYYRLVKIKTKVDPKNYFWNEQSIPSILSH